MKFTICIAFAANLFALSTISSPIPQLVVETTDADVRTYRSVTTSATEIYPPEVSVRIQRRDVPSDFKSMLGDSHDGTTPVHVAPWPQWYRNLVCWSTVGVICVDKDHPDEELTRGDWDGDGHQKLKRGKIDWGKQKYDNDGDGINDNACDIYGPDGQRTGFWQMTGKERDAMQRLRRTIVCFFTFGKKCEHNPLCSQRLIEPTHGVTFPNGTHIPPAAAPQG